MIANDVLVSFANSSAARRPLVVPAPKLSLSRFGFEQI
jgi:hypothetical protein